MAAREDARIAARADREAAWSAFGRRHGLALFEQGHGALFGVHGAIDEMEMTIAEGADGLEMHAINVVWEGFAFAVCDRAFSSWCREPSRAKAKETAARRVRKLLDKSAPQAALNATLLPHKSTPVEPTTGDARFDKRFLFLIPMKAPPERVVHQLVELPSPVMVSAVRGTVQARLPDGAPEDRVLAVFRAAVAALRESAD
jgi:hypothetical protein